MIDTTKNISGVTYNGTSITIDAESTLRKLLSRSTLTTIGDSEVTSLGSYMFYYCQALTKAYFPKVKSLGNGDVFYACDALVDLTLDFGNITSIPRESFGGCKVTSFEFTKATSVGQKAFLNCSACATIKLSKVTSIGADAIKGCTSLTDIYVGTGISTVCTIGNAAFPDSLQHIYVPESLVDSYKAASNWSTVADKITAVA